MRNLKLLATVIAISASFSVGTALAADMPVKAPPLAVAPVINWSGWYAGINIGGTWDNNRNADHVAAAGPCNPAFLGCVAVPNYSATAALASTFNIPFGSRANVIAGGQIGWNYQASGSMVLFGLEADIAGIEGNRSASLLVSPVVNPNFLAFPEAYSATVTRHVDYLGTVRGRIGAVVSPAFLLYATGGLAYGGVRSSTAETMTFPGCAGAGTNCNGVGGGSTYATRAGYTVGAGGEWMFLPNWSVKGEYLYYDLGRVNHATALNQFCTGVGCAVNGGLFASTTGTTSTRFDGHIVRIGLNYHFGGPVVARY
jgi:outer membrane immunogenic protein